jgi:hypothetical protein
MTQSCWLYVDIVGVVIMNGPLAKSLPFCFAISTDAFCSDVLVIGGPNTSNHRRHFKSNDKEGGGGDKEEEQQQQPVYL